MAQSILHFGADNSSELALARALRFEVFCAEQGVPADLEMDGLDDACIHFLLRDDGEAAATARVRPVAPGIFKLERMAVKRMNRAGGVGRRLVTHILAKLRGDDVSAVVLHAQTHVEGFYRRLGFVGEGEVYMEAGIPHRTMRLDLAPIAL